MNSSTRVTVLAFSLSIASIALFVVAPTAAATFGGANGHIAFSRLTKGQEDLWVLNPRTGKTTRLTFTARARESLPDWNATGTRLAYTRCGLSESSNCDIWSMLADGGDRHRLTRADSQETWPSWSPDGSRIVYTSNADDELQDIYAMDSDGTNGARLTTSAGFDAFAEWSPDGTRIAFTSDRAAPDDLWVMNPDGSDPTRLTRGKAIDERPDWSADGSLITFSRNGNIWTVHPDGSDPVRLTSNRAFEFGPTFSPDGRKIAYNRQSADGRIGVWIMDADGSHVRQRTFGRLDLFPDWQPHMRAPSWSRRVYLRAVTGSRNVGGSEGRRSIPTIAGSRTEDGSR